MTLATPVWRCPSCRHESYNNPFASRQACPICPAGTMMDRTLANAPVDVCPFCHNRGSYRGTDGVDVQCECPATKIVKGIEHVRARLLAVYSPQQATFWLESPIPALGRQRPIDVLRAGKVDEVMAVVDRIPEIIGAAARFAADETTHVLVETLQAAGHSHIAAAVRGGRIGQLEDRDRATLDAAATGTGFLLKGRRLDPRDVQVILWAGVVGSSLLEGEETPSAAE